MRSARPSAVGTLLLALLLAPAASAAPPAWRGDLPARAFDGAPALAARLLAARAAAARAELAWEVPAGSAPLSVYRRDASGTWSRVGAPALDGPGRATYVDAAVVPGARYAWCLGAGAGGAERFGGEARLEIPGAPALAVRALARGPEGGTRVAFSLPDDSIARVEVLDAAGASRWRRDFVPAAGGEQALRVESARPLDPGVYVVRLAQGPRLAMARLTLAP